MLRYTKHLLLGAALLLAATRPALAGYTYVTTVGMNSGSLSSSPLNILPISGPGNLQVNTYTSSFPLSTQFSSQITLATLSTGILDHGNPMFSSQDIDIRIGISYNGKPGYGDVIGHFFNPQDGGQPAQYGGKDNLFYAIGFMNTAGNPLPIIDFGADGAFIVQSVGYSFGDGTGQITAVVAPFTGGTGTPAQTTPEPSTLLMSCLGLTLVGAAAWRKRRQSLAVSLA